MPRLELWTPDMTGGVAEPEEDPDENPKTVLYLAWQMELMLGDDPHRVDDEYVHVHMVLWTCDVQELAYKYIESPFKRQCCQ